VKCLKLCLVYYSLQIINTAVCVTLIPNCSKNRCINMVTWLIMILYSKQAAVGSGCYGCITWTNEAVCMTKRARRNVFNYTNYEVILLHNLLNWNKTFKEELYFTSGLSKSWHTSLVCVPARADFYLLKKCINAFQLS
jgi:hypothetical protein